MAVKKVSIPTDLQAARAVEREVLERVRSLGYTSEAIFAIKLALEEALINAIKHGNAGDSAKCITIEYAVTRARAVLVVIDEGSGFRPSDVPDPTADENLECPTGRGIMLMRAYMDAVEFNERGNAVRLTKRNA